MQELKCELEQAGFISLSPVDNKALSAKDLKTTTRWSPEIPENRLLTSNATAVKPPSDPRAAQKKYPLNFLQLFSSQRDSEWETLIPVQQELQITALLNPRASANGNGNGGLVLSFILDKRKVELEISRNGVIKFDSSETICEGRSIDEPLSFCIRLQSSETDLPELALWVWRGEKQRLFQKYPFKAFVRSIKIFLSDEAESAASMAEHVSVITFSDLERREVFDAQIRIDAGHGASSGSKNSNKNQITELFQGNLLKRALVLWIKSPDGKQGLNKIVDIQQKYPGRVFAMIKTPVLITGEEDAPDGEIPSLEKLWCEDKIIGLAFELKEGRPHTDILQWAEKRQVITSWNLHEKEDLQWLEKTLLRPYRFPVILQTFNAYAEEKLLCGMALELIKKYKQVYLSTRFIPCGPMMESTARQAPDRILFSSDFPTSDFVDAVADIERLEVSRCIKRKMLFDNLEQLVIKTRLLREEEMRLKSAG